MKKTLRITLGSICVLIGTVGFILPGSILFLVAGLLLLSMDFLIAKKWLKWSQRNMATGARKLDKFLLARKLNRH